MHEMGKEKSVKAVKWRQNTNEGEQEEKEEAKKEEGEQEEEEEEERHVITRR